MLDPGEDPGGGPLARPVEDSGPCQRSEESLPAVRQRIVGKLKQIEEEEERLLMLMTEFRKKKQVCAKLYSKRRSALRPELKDLEQAVKRQKELVSSLKENSGIFKEKYKNEERFNRMRRRAASCMEGDPTCEEMQVKSESAESEKVGPEDEPSVSTPQTPAEPSMAEASVPFPPQQCGTSEPEDEGSDMLDVINKLEASPDSAPQEGEEKMDTIPSPVEERPVERAGAGTMCVQDGGIFNNNGPAEGCSATDSQPRPIDNVLQAINNCQLQSAERSMDNTETLPGPGTAAVPVNGGGDAGSSSTTTLQESTAAKTVMAPRIEAECSGEGVGPANQKTAIPADSDSLPAGLNVSEDKTAKAGRKTYAGVAATSSGKGEQAGREHGDVLSSSLFKRRNVVQLKWEGDGNPPHRRVVVDKILQMGFRPADIFALISPAGSYEYDLSFIRPESLDIFWEKFEHVCRGLPDWKGLIPKLVSRQPLIKMVTILVRNESIPQGDLTVWLRRYGDVLSPLRKILDDRGIWTGGWSVQLKLKVIDNVVQHLPSSAFLGRDRLTIFYPGQPKLCNKCGDKGHLASSCPVMKCSLCQGIGHLAKDCNIIRCNLCNAVGHPYSQCPEAMHNKPELMREFFRLDMEDAQSSSAGGPVIPSESVPIPNVSPQSVPIPNVSVSPQSVPIPNVSVSPQSVPIPNVSASPQSVPIPNVSPQSVPIPNVSVSPQSVGKVSVAKNVSNPSVSYPSVSSKIAEAARGAEAGALSAVPVPLPRRCRVSVKGHGVQRSGVDGEEAGLVVDKGRESGGEDRCGEVVDSDLSKDDMEWLEDKRKRGKRKGKKRGAVTLSPEVLHVENKFGVLSDDDDDDWDSFSSASSMDDECQGATKRAGSPGRGSSRAKKRLPRLP
ncbi:uncharacterized protein LOC143956474 [Lithobates pipiens]